MDISERLDGDLLILNVRGDLDASSSIQMDDCIKHAVERGLYKIIVNAEQLKYISSAGIGVFISYHEDFRARKGQFVFCCLQMTVREVFDILGLMNVFEIAADEKTAVQIINEG